MAGAFHFRQPLLQLAQALAQLRNLCVSFPAARTERPNCLVPSCRKKLE